MEVVNRSLENLLRCLVGDNPKGQDTIVPWEKFSYNNSINRSISKFPFQIVYGSSPRNSSGLWQSDKGEISSSKVENFVKRLKNIHEEVRKYIIKMNKHYKDKVDVKMR